MFGQKTPYICYKGTIYIGLYSIYSYDFISHNAKAIQLDDSFDDTNRRFMRMIQESEVREALKRMKGGKSMGPNGIPIKA